MLKVGVQFNICELRRWYEGYQRNFTIGLRHRCMAGNLSNFPLRTYGLRGCHNMKIWIHFFYIIRGQRSNRHHSAMSSDENTLAPGVTCAWLQRLEITDTTFKACTPLSCPLTLWQDMIVKEHTPEGTGLQCRIIGKILRLSKHRRLSIRGHGPAHCRVCGRRRNHLVAVKK